MRTLIVSVKQALCGSGFISGVSGMIAVVFISSFDGLIAAFRARAPLESGYCMRLMISAFQSDAFSFALPILCALPFTAAFVDDIKSGFIKARLPRATVISYIRSNGIACAVSGGLCAALGLLAACGVVAFIILPLEARGANNDILFLEFMNGVLLCFLSGALWAMVGATFAALTLSKYMAYASPFVTYYALIILCERYFNGLYALYPRQWLAPSAAWAFGGAGVISLLVVLILVLIMCFSLAAKRRLARI